MSFDVSSNPRVRATAAKDVLLGLWAAPIAWLMASSVATAQEKPAGSSSTTTLPEIRVIATTPMAPPRTPVRPTAAAATPTPARTPARAAARAPAPTPAVAAAPETAPKAVPGAVELDKIPSNVVTVGAPAFDGRKAPDLLQSLDRALPGVSLSSQTGNEFQLDVNYRGYVAGPVIGTPEGLAVYQNGVRINEVFGDVVNWDLIPQKAINQLTLVPSNPVYGLNATGGALAFEMKNGYTYHAVEGEIIGGSYGRAGATVQAGGEVGNLSGYITADAIDDAGWRTDSPSSLRRVYADLGARGAQNSTSTSRGQTTTSAPTRPLPCKCSRRIGRAPTRCRKRRKISLPS
jgi:iron complex outermembrane recepter protein